MFSSKSKSSSENAQQPAAQMAAPSPAPARRMARTTSAPSLISADLVVNGTLTSTGDVQIDGRVEGDVRSVGLVIGDKALIHGEVLAEDLTVRGRIEGSIRARKVLLAATAHVVGNILHEAFAVEAGAFFEGNCRHSDNPLADEHKPGSVVRPAGTAPASAPAQATSAAPSMAGLQPPEPQRSALGAGLAATVAPLKTGA